MNMVDSAFFMRESEAMLTRLYHTAYYMLTSKQDAEDAVQQALMKAWAARDRARPDTFQAWLARITVNECRNIQRHRHRVVPSDTVEQEGTPFHLPDPDLMTCVQSLPDALRIPFVLKYLACLSEQEVAHALHLPVSTIKNRLYRARQTLRRALEAWEVPFG